MSTKTPHHRPSRELRAMAFAIADEIETVAQRYIARGYNRREAVTLAIMDIAGA